MISKLKGLVEEVGDTWVVLDVQGVGYHVTCSSRTLGLLPSVGEGAVLWTHMNVREDDLSLFGFHSQEERRLFRLLTCVQGVGNRVGIALLGIGAPQEMLQAISLQDKSYLTRAEGVGPKLAARLVSELKEKVAPFFETTTADGARVYPLHGGGAAPATPASDAVAALVGLGYRLGDAAPVVDALMKSEPTPTLQEVIRLALAQLSKV